MMRFRPTAHAMRVVPWSGGLLLLIGAGALQAQIPTPPKHVLLLHQTDTGGPTRTRFAMAFVEALRAESSVPIELFEETIGTEQFTGPEQSRRLTEYLTGKYADEPIDVIAAQGTRALTFARQNRQRFGNPPIVTTVSPAGEIDPDDDIVGLQGGLWINGTLDLALRLRPETRTVVVVDGTLENDGDVEAEVRRQWNERKRGLDLVYLRDLPLDGLASRLAAIPQDAVVLFIRQKMRDSSHDLEEFDGLAQVVALSPVPIFTQMEEFLGRGVLGGYIWRFEIDAKRLARMAALVAGGTRARDVPSGQNTYTVMLDWRQLQRWKIPESRLPAASVVLFRPQSFFSVYRGYVAGGALIFIAQFALIVGLLAQRLRRRRAEEELRRSEARYRSVVETQTELICRFLPDTTLTFVNDAYCRFAGRTREQLVGKKFIELVPLGTRPDVLEHLSSLRSGTASHEHRVTLPDGKVGWHYWTNHAVLDDRGRLREFQGIGRDITDRKRAEEAAGRFEARNTAILRAIPDLMFVLLRDGTYVDYHARDPKLLFLPPGQFIGKTVRDVLPSPTADLLMNAVEAACCHNDPVVVEYELPVDQPRWFEARLVYAEHDSVLSIVRDMTEWKRAIAVNHDLAGRLIASQEIERAHIARELHDGVGQDIAAISVDMSQIRQTRGDINGREVEELLQSIEQRTAGVAETLRRLSHGLHPTVLQHIGFEAALQAHCTEIERQHDVAVHFHSEGPVEPLHRLVALSLFRIAQEALRNAVKHGRARHASVSIVRSGTHLTMVVTDDGNGFDLAAVAHREGLGLVSMEERARLVQGRVVIQTRPGDGTTIEVTVPVAVTKGADAHRHGIRAPSAAATWHEEGE